MEELERRHSRAVDVWVARILSVAAIIISLAYGKPVTVGNAKKRLHLDQNSFYDLISDIDSYFNFEQKPDYEQSLITLSACGKEAVEQNRRARMKDAFDFIVAMTAFAAFIKSFFF